MIANRETCLTDEELIDAFETTTLPLTEWTHRAHVRVAYIYLKRPPFVEAVDQIRIGIQRYNKAHGIPSTPTGGYHETVTVAFTTLVASGRSRSETMDSTSFLALNPELLNKEILTKYYSKGLLSSASARRSFLAPDLNPLPSVYGDDGRNVTDDGLNRSPITKKSGND